MEKRELQELKKQKLLEILNNLPSSLKVKTGRPSGKKSTYRSVYLRYLWWKKRYPKELPDFKEIWVLGLDVAPTKFNKTQLKPYPTKRKKKSFWELGVLKKANFSNQQTPQTTER